MKILALDTSAKTASAAVTENNCILAQSTIHTGLTHSQTLMPMIMGMLEAAQISLSQIEQIAVSHGPGSFTGIRIGIGACKGMAQGLGVSCVGVSTLEALAYNFRGISGIICPVMDARCKQVYTALFQIEGDSVQRLQDDEAISITELAEILQNLNQPITLVGDGAELCFRELAEQVAGLNLAPPQLRFQMASSVAFASENAVPCDPAELMPVYLRLPQAERELNRKLSQQSN
ncbi:MAG: tRNA (adenosine(37)-N6)-threonylcarbamoyltransferase complex dimerization subunit type 1 TsaB [Candidatus Merdivicinus sp.]